MVSRGRDKRRILSYSRRERRKKEAGEETTVYRWYNVHDEWNELALWCKRNNSLQLTSLLVIIFL